MRTGWGGEVAFDMPPRFGLAERRLAGLAVAAWQAAGRRRVVGLDGNSLTIASAGAVIIECGAVPAAAFGFAHGMALAGRDGLAAVLLAVCNSVRSCPRPAPFEARLSGHGRGLVLVRGIALPLFDEDHDTGFVQVVLNWREALNRAAVVHLRREISVVLRHSPSKRARIDPFSCNSAG